MSPASVFVDLVPDRGDRAAVNNHEERIHDTNTRISRTHIVYVIFCYCFHFVLCIFGGVFRPFSNSPVLPFSPSRRALARNVQFVISSLFTSPLRSPYQRNALSFERRMRFAADAHLFSDNNSNNKNTKKRQQLARA